LTRHSGGWLFRFPDQGPDGGATSLIDRYGTLSLAMSTDAPLRPRQLCLVSLRDAHALEVGSDSVRYVAVAWWGPRITSFERRLTLNNSVEIEGLPLEELREALPARVRRHFGDGAIPPATFEAVLSELVARGTSKE
jgi:hypothetical protein